MNVVGHDDITDRVEFCLLANCF